jgi:Dpy-30 motif
MSTTEPTSPPVPPGDIPFKPVAPITELPLEALPLKNYYDLAIYPKLVPLLKKICEDRREDPLQYLAELCLNQSL